MMGSSLLLETGKMLSRCRGCSTPTPQALMDFIREMPRMQRADLCYETRWSEAIPVDPEVAVQAIEANTYGQASTSSTDKNLPLFVG